MKRIARACERKPYVVILIVILITAFMSYGAIRVSTTAEIRKFLPQDYPSVRATLELENKFGRISYESVLIRSNDVTKADIIRTILGLESTLENDPELENYITRVEAYTDYIIPLVENYNLLSDHQLEQSVRSLLAQPRIKARVAGLLSEDREAALIKIYTNTKLPRHELIRLTGVFHDRVDEFKKNKNLIVGMTGELTSEMEINEIMVRDNSILIPTAIALVIIILFLTFRRFSDVFMSLLIVSLSAFWVVGAMGYFGTEFMMIHVALVPLIFGIGIDHSIHMLNRYYEERGRGRRVERSVGNSIRTVGVAIFLAALTTIFGFSSFTVSDLPPIRTLGAFAALGVLFSFILATTLLPSMLVIRDRRKAGEPMAPRARGKGKIDGVLLASVKVAERRRRPIILAAVCITAICVYSAFGLSTTMTLRTFLPGDMESLVTSDEITEHFGGQSVVFVLAKGNIVSPSGLLTMYALENSILSDNRSTQNGLITGSMSLTDAILMYTRGTIPTVDQTTGIIENLRKNYPHLMQMLMTEEGDEAAIYFFGNARTDEDTVEATKIVREHIENFTGGSLDLTTDGKPAVGGALPIISDILDRIKPSMVKTTILALLLCLIALCLIFKSPLLGAIGLLPVLLTVSWEFGTLRGLGLSLDVLNLGISSLVIGMGVDFAVHTSHRFREEWRKHGRSPEQSIRITVMNVGTALLAATATTCSAFGVLLLSRMPTVQKFGGLSALMVIYALVATLLILPSILMVYALRRRRR